MPRQHERPRETVSCPLCHAIESSLWATENSYQAVRCAACGIIYVNPRPSSDTIDQAVRSGAHTEDALNLNVKGRRVGRNIARYQRLVGDLFNDVMAKSDPISWLDVGAGYGEIVEAITRIAPPGSRIDGIEPMKHKVDAARARGLAIQEGYLADVTGTYGFVSVINVFSHIPDFRSFLEEVRGVMLPEAQIFIETGNLADIGDRRNFPNLLTLPDHLVFAGEKHIRRFLTESGFEIVRIERYRVDGLTHFAKTLAKRALGRRTPVRLPYTSPTRTMLVRARRVR